MYFSFSFPDFSFFVFLFFFNGYKTKHYDFLFLILDPNLTNGHEKRIIKKRKERFDFLKSIIKLHENVAVVTYYSH